MNLAIPLDHLPQESVPVRLAHLHRVLRPGDVVHVSFSRRRPDVRGSDPGARSDRHPLNDPDHVDRIVQGAGFAVEAMEPALDRGAGSDDLGTAGPRVRIRRLRSLPDTVGPEMRLLVIGLNPSEYAADVGIGFARPGNRFWPAALAAGLVTRDRDPDDALETHGIGMTDLVKRATRRADQLHAAEYTQGLQRVAALVAWLEPAAVCFVGLAGWRAAVDPGAKAGAAGYLGGRPVYLMPSTSGLNAHSSLDDLVVHLRSAAALAAEAPRRPEKPSSGDVGRGGSR